MNPTDSAAPVSYSPTGAAAASGLSRTAIFEAMKDGRLQRRKFGTRTLIARVDLEDFIASLGS